MLPKERPQEYRLGNDRIEEPLDGAIASTIATPARHPHHGDPTGHGQHSQRDAAELADRRHRDLRLETKQEW